MKRIKFVNTYRVMRNLFTPFSTFFDNIFHEKHSSAITTDGESSSFYPSLNLTLEEKQPNK